LSLPAKDAKEVAERNKFTY